MSFSSVSVASRPVWTTETAEDGNFSTVNVVGITIVPEVGFGAGGFGEGGFDAPSQVIPGASIPIWTVYTTK